MTLRDVKMIATLSCDEASRLASESLDRPLSWQERWALRLHALVCGNCRRLLRQFRSMRALLSNMPQISQTQLREKLPQLSADRKQQMKQLLLDARRSEQG